MKMFIASIAFACGYAASIYTWSKVKEIFNGLENEALALREKARALEKKIRG